MAKRSKITFHRDFKPPSSKERSAALGPFPFLNKSTESRERMLSTTDTPYRPSLRRRHSNDDDDDDEGSKNGDEPQIVAALSDLDDRKLYVPTRGSVTSFATPKPVDEMDWLAQIPEEGQTFEEYVSFLTSRTSGRIRPIANPEGQEIILLPIVRRNETTGVEGDDWPETAPPLSKLVEYTEAFFDRRVRVLPAALLHVSSSSSSSVAPSSTNGKKGGAKRRKVDTTDPDVGAFASSTGKGRFKLSFPRDPHGNHAPPVSVAGRADFRTRKIQLGVASLLTELSDFRRNRYGAALRGKEGENEFCIMALTMEDLYDGPTDLFCAGMAFGGDKVAVFSLGRYHPFLKMSPSHWHDYGYTNACDGYSYYDDDVGAPEGLQPNPPTAGVRKSDDDDDDGGGHAVEFLRRSGKLLTHELGHLYGLDHCVHNRCLMMGTGHLVEDFMAPSHLCGVCLRKLQWRLGFDVGERYRLLGRVFRGSMGMTKEADWCEKQCSRLGGK